MKEKHEIILMHESILQRRAKALISPFLDVLVCESGEPKTVADEDDQFPECSKCNGKEEVWEDKGTLCDRDGVEDVPRDCWQPGCAFGNCSPTGAPDPTEEKEDKNPHDCYEPVCTENGPDKKKVWGGVKDESGKCMFCTETSSGFGMVDRCQQNYSDTEEKVRDDGYIKSLDCVTPIEIEEKKITVREIARRINMVRSVLCVDSSWNYIREGLTNAEQDRRDCYYNCNF